MLRLITALIGLLLFVTPAFADCTTPAGYTRWGSGYWRITATMPSAPIWERLPSTTPVDIPAGVKELGRASTGIGVHIVSNTDTLRLCWSNATGTASYINWTQSSVSGLDVYYRTASTDGWRWLDLGEAATASDNTISFALGSSESREFLIYLPQNRRLTTLRIETPSTFTVSAGTAPTHKPLVVYGSSIVQGSGTSRGGIAYPQALGRHYGADTINLGFAGSCQMFAGMATMLATIDASAFIIDCFPNMTDAQITAQMGTFLTTLATARPTVPIYIVQDRLNQSGGPHPLYVTRQADNEAAASAVLATLTAFTNIHWIPADDLLGDDYEGTVDGSHPSDLGHYRYTQALEAAIGSL